MRLSSVLILAALATAVLCHSADSGSKAAHHSHHHGSHHGHGHGHGHHSHHHHGHHGHKHGHGHGHGHHHNSGHNGQHHPSHHSSKKHHKPAEPHIHYFQDNIDLDKVSASQLKDSFKEWKKEFGKKYATTSEEAAHYQTYLSNWRMIITHNKATNESFKMGMNQFADLTQQQFVSYIGSCFKGGAPRKLWKEKARAVIDELTPHLKANPASVDWTTKGVVTPVKNQGQCGSCWAFSTTGSLECRAAIKTGKLVSLSEQQLVDCSRAEGNMGCNGGLMDDAFKYIKKEGGLCSESEYPYKASDGVCKAASCGTKYDAITGYKDVAKDSAPDLETAAAQGCVSVAIEADQSAFQFYKSGILTGRCGTRLDHGVLVVGYGEEGGKKYWKVKNSWGRTWGEEGYVRICKECGKDLGKGECGILEQPSYPTV